MVTIVYFCSLCSLQSKNQCYVSIWCFKFWQTETPTQIQCLSKKQPFDKKNKLIVQCKCVLRTRDRGGLMSPVGQAATHGRACRWQKLQGEHGRQLCSPDVARQAFSSISARLLWEGWAKKKNLFWTATVPRVLPTSRATNFTPWKGQECSFWAWQRLPKPCCWL